MNTISPGEAATDSHSRGDKDLTAHWGTRIDLAQALNEINLDGGSAVIDFTADNGEGSFSMEIGSDAIPVLRADAPGMFTINGLALKVIYETGMPTVEIAFENTRIHVDTLYPASGSEYDRLKSMGVGARRLDYVFGIDADGNVRYAVLLDGQETALPGTHKVYTKEDTEE